MTIKSQAFRGAKAAISNLLTTGSAIKGTVLTPGATVTISKDGTALGTATADSSGNFTYATDTTGGGIYRADVLSGLNLPVLGPATASVQTGAAAGSDAVVLTGLQAGETIASFSPNDGRLVTNAAATKLVKGGSAMSAGTIAVSVTTTSGRTLATTLTAVAASLASGAAGLWRFSDINTATGTVPNAQAVTPHSGNLLRAPRRLFSNNGYWSLGSVTVSNDGTTALSITGANGDATTFTPSAAGWYMQPANVGTLPAGAYTAVFTGVVASGTKQLYISTTGNPAGRQAMSGVTTTTPGRVYLNFTAASAFSAQNVLLCGDGTDTAAFTGMDFELFAGTLTPAANATSALAGHLTLGKASTDTTTAGKYASGELDMSTTSATGLIQFPTAAFSGAFTAQALVRKTLAGSSYQAFLSKVQNYAAWSAWLSQLSIPNYANGAAFGSGGGAALWDRLGEGSYHVFTHRFDGTKYSVWLDDICLNAAAGSAPGAVLDLWFNTLAGLNNTTGDRYAGVMTLYASALTDAQLIGNVTAIINEARSAGATNSGGATIDVTKRFLIVDGDSRSTSPYYPSLLGPNVSPKTLGTLRSVGGSTLVDAYNRLTALPTVPTVTGRKMVYLMGMEGTNGGIGTGGSTAAAPGETDAQAAQGYYNYMGSVLDLAVSKGYATDIVLCTENPTNDTTHNTRRDLLNPKYRTAVPGSATATRRLADLDVGPFASSSDWVANGKRTATGSITSSSNVVTGLSIDATTIRLGAQVDGTGIPTGAYVASIQSSTQITLGIVSGSANATATNASASLTIGFSADFIHQNSAGDRIIEPIMRAQINAALAA